MSRPTVTARHTTTDMRTIVDHQPPIVTITVEYLHGDHERATHALRAAITDVSDQIARTVPDRTDP